MKKLSKSVFIILFTILVNQGFASSFGEFSKPTPKNNDSTINIRSNIVIFKMITSPPINSGNNGSLKKAGKVARTSSSHSLSYTHSLSPARTVS